MTNKPRVIYVSYDGAAEPLGVSQIIPYLELLSREFSISLISFEKPGADVQHAAERLEAAGVTWHPQTYHAFPKIGSTVRDVVTGTKVIDELAREQGCDIIHVRSYVPALMATRSVTLQRARLLFDMRGFWADERVEGGIWRRGLLYRLAKRQERRFFSRADGVVTLTEASLPWIRSQLGSRSIPVEVIPTCVALDRFAMPSATNAEPVAIWSGSVGTWYRFDLATAAADALELPLRVITRDVQAARKVLGDRHPAEIISAQPAEMPGLLCDRHVGLCIVQPSFSKLASAPTRMAEHLACGAPVLVTAGVGDMKAIAEADSVGAAFDPDVPATLSSAASDLKDLLADPTTPGRCRATAEARFSATAGSAMYAAMYGSLLGRGPR